MKNSIIKLYLLFLAVMLAISLAGSFACAGATPAIANQPATAKPEATPPAVTNPAPPAAPEGVSKAVSVVVAGYINHGPLQPTVQAIKQVTVKYGDRVTVTWIDLTTKEGEAYFKEHGLSAHMNVIINGKYQYSVNGKDVTFQWFEGQQWKRQYLDTVLSGLVGQ